MPKFSLWPLLGFVNSVPRKEVPFQAFTGPSLNWLVGRQRLRRRAGSAIVGDTITSGHETTGFLESKWGAKARRIRSVQLKNAAETAPTWMVLYGDHADKEAQLAVHINSDDSVHVLGKEFDSYHYAQPVSLRSDAIPNFIAVPYVYDNEHGGMTIARAVSAKQRRFMCGGSRDLLSQDEEVCWPGADSAPGKWNSRFNYAVATGDESFQLYPLGLIPPLQIPPAAAGNDVGTSQVSPFLGSDAFFYTWVFENERGELSAYPIPRPPDSAWVGYAGFGYFQVSAAHPTHYFDSVVFPVPIGPPGTRARRLLRSTKVTVTGSAPQFPASGELFFCARIDNNTETTFTLREGNDLSLDTSPIPQQLVGMTWPYRARSFGRFDGRAVLGSLRPNPYALIVAPWANGSVNAPIDSAILYGATQYYVAVTPTALIVRSVTAGTPTDRSITLAGRSLRTLVDFVSTTQTSSTITEAAYYDKGFLYLIVSGAPTVSIGDEISASMTDFSPGTKVTGTAVDGAFYRIYISRLPLATVAIPGPAKNVDFTHLGTDATNPAPWGCQVVPGADADQQAEQLLRTLVTVNGTWSNGGTSIVLASNAAYVTPGMLVYSSKFPAGTEVTSVDATTQTVTVDTAATALGAAESISFAYDTGDATRYTVDALGASSSQHNVPNAAAGQVTVLNKNNAAGTVDANDATVFDFTVVASGATTVTALEEYTIGTCNDDNIASVRVTIRAKKTDITNTPTCSVAPCIAGATAPGVAALVVDTTLRDFVFDMATDPVASSAWTKANINSYRWGVIGTVVSGALNDSAKITVAKVKVEVVFLSTTSDPGYIRTFGNAWPALLPWRKIYLDQFTEREQTLAFSSASPGYAQNGINTYFVGNQRTGHADFGKLMGFAEMGAFLFVFQAKGRMKLWNPRTGLTHADEDYNLSVSSWTRGCRSPYAICQGNGWCIFLADEGFFVVGLNDGEEHLISKAIYDAEAPVGKRGELEYALSQCIIASETDSDSFKIHAQVERGVLLVRYFSSSSVDTFDREIRYDFSMGTGREGVAEVLQSSGAPYPWSTPLTMRVSCSCLVAKADGIHNYGALDTNAGTADGRVDEINTGTQDNGQVVSAVGYTGVLLDKDLNQFQPTMLRVVSEKAGPGLTVAITRTPEHDPEVADWDEIQIPTSGGDAYGRTVGWLKGHESIVRPAISARIMDDGSGPCPDVTETLIDAAVVPSTK